MAHKVSVGIDWQGSIDYAAIVERVKIADAAGVHSVWIPEAWGRDAFTILSVLAYETTHIQLGTGIVNIYSRTPAALAQHFATLDELSGGRMIIGLGTSGAQVIEHFHGVPFEPPRTRLKEYIEIINTLMKGDKLNYQGKLFNLQRGFTLRFQPVRDQIPIWLPMQQLKAEIDAVRSMSAAAGRPADAVSVRAPSTVAVTPHVARARAVHAGTAAFYIGRMGVYYAAQLTRLGHGQTVEQVKRAWQNGSRAAAEAVTAELVDETFCAGPVEACLDRMQEQEACGVDVHTVSVEAADNAEYERILTKLTG